jgi:TolA-binding protein
MAGCGCKKRNEEMNNQVVNVQLDGSNMTPPQQITIMEKQINEIFDKIEELNNETNNDQEPE